MTTQPLAHTVYCDEAGFTGNNLLDEHQPAFAYASVAIEESEADKVVRRIRADSRLQEPELKGARLAKSTRGRAAILDALRAHFGHVESFLMDRSTLLEFEPLWGTEDSPLDRDLPRLSAEERALYDDLRDNRIGRHLRLEQERIGFGWMKDALARL